MKIFLGGLLFIILLIGIFVLYKRMTNVADYVQAEFNLEVRSDAFQDGGKIPVRYTGNGEDLSPPLKIGKLDPGAETIAIIMDDVDHPMGVYNHWLIWNIPASFSEIPEGIPHEDVVTSLGNAVQGKSGYGGKHYYRGPKPPFNLSHKYIFKVYVLDTTLELDKNADKEELQKAIDGHILQYGTLTGIYK
ncbi:MAG: YbhB/YbcL family Raf kinase inhibitor-like protein [Halanaerobiales bacterium]